MPCEVKPRFVILYGSQKGQAQSIAEGVAEEAEEHGLVADLSCLDQSEKVCYSFFLGTELFSKLTQLTQTITYEYYLVACMDV